MTKSKSKSKAEAKSEAEAKLKRRKSTSLFGLLKRLWLCIVPHEHNSYRPHLIRRYGLLVILLLVVLSQSLYLVFMNGNVLGDEADITVTRLLSATNEARDSENLEPLQLNDKLSSAATAKAQNMLEVGYWSHDAPDGTTPWQWIMDAHYAYVDAGENLARGFHTVDGVMRAWLESPNHRANVLGGNYTEVGFAAVNGTMGGKKTTVVVAMYARPISAPNAGGDRGSVTHNPSGTESDVNTWTYLRRGTQNLTPSLLFTLILLGLATCASVLAHTYRKRLPLHLRRSWYRHHALYKLVFLAVLAVGAVLSYGGGMI